jgi:hypothetical protein
MLASPLHANFYDSNGQLRENIVQGTTQEQFTSRLRRALGEDGDASASSYQSTSTPLAAPEPPSQLASPPSNTTSTAPYLRPVPAPQVNSLPQAVPLPPTPAPPQTTPSSPSTSAQTLQNERAARTESKGKRRADAEPEPSNNPVTSSSRSDWIAQQKQKQSDARRERDRILAQIEADKAERKARREEEKRERLQEQGATQLNTPRDRPMKQSNATFTKLQVRLLDGGTIREQFPADATITEHVRPWIDGHLETQTPYTFKQILAPQPARSISISEEQESLRDLGLLPSATLVLQPIHSYTEAYGPTGNNGSLLNLPYNAVTGAYGLVTGTLTGAARWLRGGTYEEPGPDGHVLGEQEAAVRPDPSAPMTSTPASGSTGTGGMRVRTLADQRADRGENQQFYNGNSLDFQPDDR